MAVEDSIPHSRDLYQRLGLSRSASNDDIKRHYRKLAMKWHPDKNPDNREAAAEKFRLISQAYECLSDEKKRQDYDRFGVIPGEHRTSSEATGARAARSAFVGTRSFDPFGPMDPTGMFFSFERAQRIFEAFFGTRDPFSMFDDDPMPHPFGGASIMPSLFETQNSLLNGLLSNDFFAEPRGRHGNLHTTSLITTGSLGGGESVSKSIMIVNGRKTTRTETTTIGADGIARRTVTEEVEDLPESSHRSQERHRTRLLGRHSSREANSKGSARQSTPMKLISSLSQSSAATKLPPAAPSAREPLHRTSRRVPLVSSSSARVTPFQFAESSNDRSRAPSLDVRKRNPSAKSVNRTTPASALPNSSASTTDKRLFTSTGNLESSKSTPGLVMPPADVMHRVSTRVPIVSTLAEIQVPTTLETTHPTLDVPRPTSQANLYTPRTDRVVYPNFSRSESIRNPGTQTSRAPLLSSMASTQRMTPSPLATYQNKHHVTTQHASFPSFDWSSAPRPVKYAYIPPNKNVSYKATATAQ